MNVGVIVAIIIGGYFSLYLLGFHQIKEGYVGIYKRFGVLQPQLSEPGFHYKLPLIDQVLQVPVTIQTDEVTQVPCGTKDGIMVYFDRVQVVNQLSRKHVYGTLLNYTMDYKRVWVTDKLHHEINQFCSKHSLREIYIEIFDQLDEALVVSLDKDLKLWAPGLNILSIRLTKPVIPSNIRGTFQLMEKVRVDYLIACEKQNVAIEEEVTRQKQQMVLVSSHLEVKKIDLEKLIDKKNSELEMAKLEAEIIYRDGITSTNNDLRNQFEQLNGYESFMSQEYLKFLSIDALTSNLTLNIGDSQPNIKLNSKFNA